MGLQPGQELEFGTLQKDGRNYITIDCGKIEIDIDRLKEILKEKNLQIVSID
jgi:hypothetical protein